ncbi:MAG: UDP-3-O-(3-hydroxymyristoyl)glucosamine N-acyltransferase [Alphaproteobacteria bacterium]
MPEHGFFKPEQAISIKQVARLAEGQLSQTADPNQRIEDAAPLHRANQSMVSFVDNPKYVKALGTTKAGAVICSPAIASHVPNHISTILCEKPYRSFALVMGYFYPSPASTGNIHPSASIHASARIGSNVEIGAFAVIDADAVIAENCMIKPHAYIGKNVKIGKASSIGAGASIEYASIGNDCQIHAGVRIGTRGFGFAMDAGGNVEMPQVGAVMIGNHVEIGGNSTIDRGMYDDTVIGDHCRLDNLVQIAHNVILGKGCVLAAQTGISGSTVLGDHVVTGGQTGIAGHLKLGSNIMCAGKTGVTKNLNSNQIVAGFPAKPIKDWHRQQACLNMLATKKPSKT